MILVGHSKVKRIGTIRIYTKMHKVFALIARVHVAKWFCKYRKIDYIIITWSNSHHLKITRKVSTRIVNYFALFSVRQCLIIQNVLGLNCRAYYELNLFLKHFCWNKLCSRNWTVSGVIYCELVQRGALNLSCLWCDYQSYTLPP